MANIYWNAGTSGVWSDGGRWNQGRPPASVDEVFVIATSASTYQIDIQPRSVADSLTVNSAKAVLFESVSGALSIGGSLNLQAGTVILENGSQNSFGSVNLSGGVLQAASGSLGGAQLNLTRGEFTALNGGVFGPIAIKGNATIDAASGTSAEFGASGWLIDGTATQTLTFGTSARNGTVVWSSDAGSSITGGYAVDIADGTLKSNDLNAFDLIAADTSTTVAAGASLDLGGFDLLVSTPLTGGGAIVNSGTTGANLQLSGGDFSGEISGDIALTFAGALTLGGASTYTGGTKITSNGIVTLAGAESALPGDVTDDGQLIVNSTGLQTLGSISGTGSLLAEAGLLVLDNTSKFSGGADIEGGTVMIGADDALGTGTLKIGGGELIATTNVTVDDNLTLVGAMTIAASTGSTLSFKSTTLQIGDQTAPTLTFGDSTHKGTVLFSIGSGSTASIAQVTVAGGTLQNAAGGQLDQFLDVASKTVIDAGATLDIGGGGGYQITNLTDAGTLTSTVSGGQLGLSGISSITGKITGEITVGITGGTTGFANANSYDGGTVVTGGAVNIANAGAFGSGPVSFANATLAATKTLNLGGAITLTGAATVMAATGSTFTFTGSVDLSEVSGPLTLTVGNSTHAGTVVFAGSESFDLTNNLNVTFAGGVLKIGSADFGNIVGSAAVLTGVAGAKLDLNGASIFAGGDLMGSGAIVNSASSAVTLYVNGASYVGSISGLIALDIRGNAGLGGANTMTLGTTIESFGQLTLAAAGSLVGAVVDDGALVVNEAGAVTLGGAISGSGVFTQSGAGATTLSGGNSYSGGTTITKGEVIATKGAALGVGGTVTMTGGELLATGAMTLSHDLHAAGPVTIAAAAGERLVLSTAKTTLGAGTFKFGQGADTGTVVLQASTGVTLNNAAATFIEVQAGTLAAGDNALSTVLAGVAGAKVDSGAILDIAGHSTTVKSLSGSGKVTNSGAAAAFLLLDAGQFSGVIAGQYSNVAIGGQVALTGAETFTGPASLRAGSVLTIGGSFGEEVSYTGAATLVLNATTGFTGSVQYFGAAGRVIDLKSITAGASATLAYNTATKQLTISDGAHTQHISFVGAFQLGNFVASADTSGGTDITWRAAPAAPKSAAITAVAAEPAALPVAQAPSVSHLLVQAAAAMGGGTGAGMIGLGTFERQLAPLVAPHADRHAAAVA